MRRSLLILLVLGLLVPTSASSEEASIERVQRRRAPELILVEWPGTSLVRIDVVFDLPPWAEPPELAGVGPLTLDLILWGLQGDADAAARLGS